MLASPKSSVTVLYFAAASTATGLTVEEIELPTHISDAGVQEASENQHYVDITELQSSSRCPRNLDVQA